MAPRKSVLSEADLLSHYYKIISQHPAEHSPESTSVPAHLADALRLLADPSDSHPDVGGNSANDSLGEDGRKKKRSRKSEPLPSQRQRQGRKSGPGVNPNPLADSGRRAQKVLKVLKYHGQCPFTLAYGPACAGWCNVTQIGPDPDRPDRPVRAGWCDGVNRVRDLVEEREGEGVKVGDEMGDSSCLPGGGRWDIVSGEGNASEGTSTVGDGEVEETPEAKTEERKEKKEKTGRKSKQLEEVGMGHDHEVTGLMGGNIDPAFSTPEPRPRTSASQSEPTMAAPSSSQTQGDDTDVDMPLSQPTPTRPGKRKISKKDRLSMLRVEPGPRVPTTEGSSPSPSPPDAQATGQGQTDTQTSSEATVPQTPDQPTGARANGTAVVLDEEYQLEETPLPPGVREEYEKRARKEREKREKKERKEREKKEKREREKAQGRGESVSSTPTTAAADGLATSTPQTQGKKERKEKKSKDTQTPSGLSITTPMRNGMASANGTPGDEMFFTPQAGAGDTSMRMETADGGSEKKRKKEKKRKERDEGEGLEGESAKKDKSVKKVREKEGKKRDGPTWVFSTSTN